VARQLRRRRMGSYRCVPLLAGYRDPFQPWRPETLSDKQIEAAGIAARHLLDVGVVPQFDVVTLRQLWRRGDRAIAELLHDLTGGEVA
jgi:hypothetical protein